MGGTDDPQNIKNLTPLEHAEAHKKLYEEYGKIEDYLAWKGLEGFLGKEEIIYQLMVENGKRLGKRMMDEKKGIFDLDQQKTEKYRNGLIRGGKIVGKIMSDTGHCKRVAPLGGGKNLGKNFWYNPKTNQETQSFSSPGEDWTLGVNMDRVNLDFLREKASNVKGSFWITNDETGETKMVKSIDQIPSNFRIGRKFQQINTMDLVNVPHYMETENIPKVGLKLSYITFNTSAMRWELTSKKGSKRIIKVSHTDYYGLVWLRDIIIEKYDLSKDKKSEYNFTTEHSLEECLEKLKAWRNFRNLEKILRTKKLKRWKRLDYQNKLGSFLDDWYFIESIRNEIIPSL
jgi:hypothetical protein